MLLITVITQRAATAEKRLKTRQECTVDQRSPSTVQPGRKNGPQPAKSAHSIEQPAKSAHSTTRNSALAREELLEQSRALVGEHAADHLGPVVEPAVTHDIPQ